jgi:hypothetical protein
MWLTGSAGPAYAREELELPLLKLAGMRSVHSSATDEAGRAAPNSVSPGFFDCCSGGDCRSAEGARARVVAASSECRMLEETADGENGFQAANTVLVSSTVSPAAISSRALRANALAPGRQPSTQLAVS